MRISARNQLKGTVADIERGPVTTKVRITIGGGQIVTASISTEAADELKLAVGGPCYAIVKATSVMVAVDH
jgi:molybdopterin-binding protein